MVAEMMDPTMQETETPGMYAELTAALKAIGLPY